MDAQTILGLDEPSLNLAIEHAVYGWQWQQHPATGRWLGECDGKRTKHASEPPRHTYGWDSTMALAWRYGVSVCMEEPRAGVAQAGPQRLPGETARELRVAICRLALLRHFQHC